jgi:hypothetical protein
VNDRVRIQRLRIHTFTTPESLRDEDLEGAQ